MRAVTIRPIMMGMTDKNKKRVNQTLVDAGTIVYAELCKKNYGSGHYYVVRVPGTLLTQVVSCLAIKEVK